MYCTFYGLNQRPFTLTPNPEFVFLGKAHQEAFAHLIYGIENKVGFILLTGEVGAGKTTVIRTLLTRLSSDSYATALILNPMLSSLGLLKTINREFGLADSADEPAELVDSLNRFLLELKQQGKTAVLVIDEAQDLEPALLEQVRLLSNLETETEKLIQIILVGQPELEPLLGRQELRQLNQRITVRYHLTPMDGADTREYLSHRLRVAGGRPDMVRFSDAAVTAIQRYSSGLPRLVNAVADRCLLIGYTAESRLLEPPQIRQAIQDLSPQKSRLSSARYSTIIKVILAIILCALTAIAAAYLTVSKSASPRNLQELQQVTGQESACRNLLKAWGITADCSGPLESRLQQQGFELFRYTGNLGNLAQLKYPSVLETVSSSGQRQQLLFGGFNGDNSLVANQNGELVVVKTGQLEQAWTGKALIPWKNQRQLQIPVPYTRNPTELAKLADLLKAAGQTIPNPTDVSEVRAAVKRFQQQQGLEAAGVAGAQTVLMLYQALPDFQTPHLNQAKK